MNFPFSSENKEELDIANAEDLERAEVDLEKAEAYLETAGVEL